MNLLLSLGISLLATLFIELGLAWLFKIRGRGLTVTAAVNLLTNPVVVLVWHFYPVLLLPLELGAVLVEGCGYRLFPEHFKKPFLFSLFCNLTSFLIGGLL